MERSRWPTLQSSFEKAHHLLEAIMFEAVVPVRLVEQNASVSSDDLLISHASDHHTLPALSTGSVLSSLRSCLLCEQQYHTKAEQGSTLTLILRSPVSWSKTGLARTRPVKL